jgi:ABC-type phosphate transport system permease subunit
MGRRTSLVRRPSRRSRFEGAIKALLAAAAAVSILTTLAIVFSLLRETIAFFGDVPIGDYLFGTKWTPQFAGDQQSFGVLPLIWGTFYLTGIGSSPASTWPSSRRAGCARSSSRCSRCSPACRRSCSATSR